MGKTLRALSAAMLLALTSVPAAAQEVILSTPYPAVAVEAGQTATFDLDVRVPSPQTVTLTVTEAPEGWETTLRGGGFVVDAVFADPDAPPTVRLDVAVPAGVSEGTYQVVLEAEGSAATQSLELELRIAEAVAGGVTLEAEFPSLRGSSDTTFTYNVDLTNETPEETTFSLQGEGPQGWLVEARPSGQARASTTTVGGGETARLTVEVDPPDDTPAGTYPVLVRAVGGGQQAETELEVEITGNFAMRLRTPDERLNAQVRAGGSSEVPLLVINDGTAPLVDVQLSATPPSGWEVTFEPESLAQVPARDFAEVTATISPGPEAVAGDYIVTIRAQVSETSDEIDLRTTVETSLLWGLVGLVLIAAALLGLGWVFRRYGRR